MSYIPVPVPETTLVISMWPLLVPSAGLVGLVQPYVIPVTLNDLPWLGGRRDLARLHEDECVVTKVRKTP